MFLEIKSRNAELSIMSVLTMTLEYQKRDKSIRMCCKHSEKINSHKSIKYRVKRCLCHLYRWRRGGVNCSVVLIMPLRDHKAVVFNEPYLFQANIVPKDG